jgi:hypothetical protein
MSDTGILLAIMYIIVIEVFAFILLYPILRESTRGILSSSFSEEAIAFCITLVALSYGLYFMFYLITFFIGALSILIAMFAGLFLITLSRSSRINLFLFLFSATLSISSFAIQDLTKIASLINGIVYLIGIGEGAIKIILPTFKDFYAKYDSSYAELLTAFFIIICILNVVLSWLGIETPMDLQTIQNMSMVTFIVMGLLGFYYLRFISKRRS